MSVDFISRRSDPKMKQFYFHCSVLNSPKNVFIIQRIFVLNALISADGNSTLA